MRTTTTTTKSSTTKIFRKIAKAKTSETDAETFRTAIAVKLVMIKTRKQTKKAMKNKNKGQVAEEKDNYVGQRRKGEREVVKRGEQQRQQREAKDGKESDENNNKVEEASDENNNKEEEASDENKYEEEEANDENNVVAMVTAVKW